jgi:acyl carrier protein
MNDAPTRLANCFAAVFPTLDARSIPHASTASVAEWDSLASATLIAVVEEEFQIEIDTEDLEYLQSFDALLGYVTQPGRVQGSAEMS